MTEDPLFSVIVTTYERQEFLDEAIDSVLRQTVPDLEVVVVDDASPTPARVSPDPRVRLIRRERNGGLSAARNTALESSKGRYVTFLDDDDRFTDDRLAWALEGLARAPITICWRDNSRGQQPRRRILEGDVADSILEGPHPHMGVTTMHRDLVPQLDERFEGAEDVEWWLRAATRGPIHTVPRVGYVKRIHATSRHGNDRRARLRSCLLLLDVYSDYFDAHPSSAVYRWLMVWQHAQALGEHRIARRAAIQAFRLHPHPRAVTRLMRSLRPTVPTDADAAAAGSPLGGTAA